MNTEVTKIEVELKEAQADIDLAERLKTAKTRASQLSKDLEVAKAAETKAEAARAKAARDSRLSGLSNIRVRPELRKDAALTETYSLLHEVFRINWTQTRWSTMEQRPVPHNFECLGFDALPANVLEYLIEEQPQEIPAEIAALRPDNPNEAFSEYLLAKRRGHFRSASL